MQVLVINSGSSSVKFELFSMGAEEEQRLLEGEVERIGLPEPFLWVEVHGDAGSSRDERAVSAADHHEALGAVLDVLAHAGAPADLGAVAVVGHRVVHGGDRFERPTRIDDAVVAQLRELALLAPLHTNANLAGVEAARAVLPRVPHVAVFDTTFHRTMPDRTREYALPRELARSNGIRRYGFHGTSHEYVAGRAAELLGLPVTELDAVTLHLGNGASACAVSRGHSVDTSMGMTPLEGLVMGTRCGDVDPAVPMLLGELTGRSREDVHRLLNHESGLLGLCGVRDMREVHELIAEGDEDATLAFEMFCYRAKKYVGAYYAVLGRLDALVFTAGIGEHDPETRARVCEGLGRLGIEVDDDRNRAPSDGERVISPDGAEVAVFVIPTDEELEIARAALACVRPS